MQLTKIKLICRLTKYRDQALISISTMLEFPSLRSFQKKKYKVKSKITFNILVIYAQLKCTLQRRISRICNLGAGANYSLKITLKFNVKCVFNLQCNKVYYRQQKWVNTVCQWWMSKSTTVNKNTLLLLLNKYVFINSINAFLKMF